MKCEHPDFIANVTVNRLEDTGGFHADVRIHCAVCNLPFQFLGSPGGLLLDGAAVSVDGTEARLAIAPQSMEATVSGDWEQLSKEQQKDVDAVRDRMGRHLIAECEAFYKQHPELQLSWSFTCDALIRANQKPMQEL